MLTYQESFKLIESQSGKLKKTSIGTFYLIQELAMVNMVWEKYQFSYDDDRQPNMVANLIVHDVAIKLEGILPDLLSKDY